MPPPRQMPYRDQEPTTTPWVAIFVLLSILAHVVIFIIVILVALFVPQPKLESRPMDNPTVSLSLMPAPKPAAPPQPPPPKHIFMATDAQPNAPHKETLVESDNDTQLQSHSKADRSPDTIMPDVVSPKERTPDLQNSPSSPPTKNPSEAPKPPAPKPDPAKQQPPTPPQPKQDTQQAKQTPPDPAKPVPKPPEPKPPKPPTPQVVQNQVDPLTGLPVLPQINAPTLAPQTAASQTSQAATPPQSLPAIASNMQGRAGMSGAPSVASTATELGKYKAMVYRAVGSRWYQKVNNQLQIMPVGSVRVQYTIYADGSVTTKVLDGGNGTMQLLLSISINSIRESAPFQPFTDSMKQQVGDSFTDDFSFSVYSP